MLSRVADSVYWMNRYIERAENIARFLDVTHQLALDLPPGRHEPWGAVIDATGDLDLFRETGGKFDADTVTRFLCFDATYPSSIVSCVQRARENARQIREVISSDMWEQVNRFHFLLVDEPDHDSIARAPHAFLSAVKLASQQFVGIADGTMTHNEAWHFGQLGRSLERADKTSRILDVMTLLVQTDHLAHIAQVAHLEPPPPPVQAHGPSQSQSQWQSQSGGSQSQSQSQSQVRRERQQTQSEDELQWAALLKSASAFEMYRKRHGALDGTNVVDFLLFDADFPRSVRFCASLMASSVAAITDRAGAEGSMAELRVGELLAQLGMARTRDMVGDLHASLDDIQAALNHAGGGVQETFFDLSPPSDSPSSLLIEG